MIFLLVTSDKEITKLFSVETNMIWKSPCSYQLKLISPHISQ